MSRVEKRVEKQGRLGSRNVVSKTSTTTISSSQSRIKSKTSVTKPQATLPSSTVSSAAGNEKYDKYLNCLDNIESKMSKVTDLLSKPNPKVNGKVTKLFERENYAPEVASTLQSIYENLKIGNDIKPQSTYSDANPSAKRRYFDSSDEEDEEDDLACPSGTRMRSRQTVATSTNRGNRVRTNDPEHNEEGEDLSPNALELEEDEIATNHIAHREQAKIKRMEQELSREAEKLQNKMETLQKQKIDLMVKNFRQQLEKEAHEDLKKFKNQIYQEQQEEISKVTESRDERKLKLTNLIDEMNDQIRIYQNLVEELESKKEEIDDAHDACVEYVKSETLSKVDEYEEYSQKSLQERLEFFQEYVNSNVQ